jgi:hypothetical protein
MGTARTGAHYGQKTVPKNTVSRMTTHSVTKAFLMAVKRRELKARTNFDQIFFDDDVPRGDRGVNLNIGFLKRVNVEKRGDLYGDLKPARLVPGLFLRASACKVSHLSEEPIATITYGYGFTVCHVKKMQGDFFLELCPLD